MAVFLIGIIFVGVAVSVVVIVLLLYGRRRAEVRGFEVLPPSPPVASRADERSPDRTGAE
jgi:hypothetical protein